MDIEKAKAYLLNNMKDFDQSKYNIESIEAMAAFMEGYHQHELKTNADLDDAIGQSEQFKRDFLIDFIGSMNNELFDKIRKSQSDAMCRRYLFIQMHDFLKAKYFFCLETKKGKQCNTQCTLCFKSDFEYKSMFDDISVNWAEKIFGLAKDEGTDEEFDEQIKDL